MENDNVFFLGIAVFLIGVVSGVLLISSVNCCVDKDILNNICADQTNGEYPVYKKIFDEARSITCVNEEKTITLFENATNQNSG